MTFISLGLITSQFYVKCYIVNLSVIKSLLEVFISCKYSYTGMKVLESNQKSACSCHFVVSYTLQNN
jgi:hypothetical protein